MKHQSMVWPRLRRTAMPSRVSDEYLIAVEGSEVSHAFASPSIHSNPAE